MSTDYLSDSHVRTELAQKLADYGLDPAETDSIVAHVLNQSLETFLTYPPATITKDQYDQCLHLVERRGQGYSLAVLKGEKEFFGLPFLISEAVLIPRPETELLVEEALRDSKDRRNLHILDMGTGSGCILIALATSLPHTNHVYTGADLSPEALAVAKRNAARHRVTAHWVRSNLFATLPGKYDLIIANLPYVTEKQLTEVSIAQEPKIALYGGGPDGLGIYRDFLTQAVSHLAPGGIILMEIDPDQAQSLTAYAQKVFPSKKILVLKDLSGRDRCIKISGTTLASQP